MLQEFPPSVLAMVSDVVPSLRALALQTVCDNGVVLAEAVSVLPFDELRELEAYVELRRRPGMPHYRLLQAGCARRRDAVSLLWPDSADVRLVFAHGALAHVQRVALFGCAADLDLARVVAAAPRLVALSLCALPPTTGPYSALTALAPTLTHLTVSGCTAAFADPSWLLPLNALTHLDVRHSTLTSATLAALPYLSRLTHLDVSQCPAAADAFARVGARLCACRWLAVGALVTGDTDSDGPPGGPDALDALDAWPPASALPALTALTVLSERLGGADRVAVCAPLWRWAQSNAQLHVTAHYALHVQVHARPLRHCGPAPGLLCAPLPPAWLAAAPPAAQLGGLRALHYELAQVASDTAALPAWLAGAAPAPLSALRLWRFCPAAAPLRLMAAQLLMLMSRWDHAGAAHPFAHVVCARGTAAFLFVLMGDAADAAALEMRQPHKRARAADMVNDDGHNDDDDDDGDHDDDNDDGYDDHDYYPDGQRAGKAAELCATLVKLLCWSYDSTDELVSRETQAALIVGVAAHLTVARAIAVAPGAAQAAIVLYAQLSASQPYKGRLLEPVLGALVGALGAAAGSGVQEAALTCLGNLSSHAPNTAVMVARHPELLAGLVRLLCAPHDDDGAVSVAHGAAYLCGNLAYIAPARVGAPLMRLPAYRTAVLRLAAAALDAGQLGGCFWSLWSACHAYDALAEADRPACDTAAPREFVAALSALLWRFCARFGAADTIPCLWSNLKGVLRLLGSPTLCVRAFGWWLMGNINHAPKHRPKFAHAFTALSECVAALQGDGLGPEGGPGGEPWGERLAHWLAAALALLLQDARFAALACDPAACATLLAAAHRLGCGAPVAALLREAEPRAEAHWAAVRDQQQAEQSAMWMGAE